MALELPVLRLGLAGFSDDQQAAVAQALRGLGESSVWEVAAFDAADAWWMNGARTQVLAPDRIRVGSGTPEGKALQLQLTEVDRPIAFTHPLPQQFKPMHAFDLASAQAMNGVLQKFETWLAPLTAQFCLAAHIIEHQSALGSGVFELRLNGQLLAVVDMQGEVAVRSTSGPSHFEGAMWRRQSRPQPIPDNFVRTSLSQLMWQYALRSQRDALPKHYRTGLIYFRRAPRLPQRLLKDSHLVLMRQLSVAPSSFRQLQELCNTDELRLARDLAALYLVGSITSNPKRAARPPAVADAENTGSAGPHSHLFGNSGVSDSSFRRPTLAPADLTAPAPLIPDC